MVNISRVFTSCWSLRVAAFLGLMLAADAKALTVTLDKQVYKSGDTVMATITSPKTVLVENSIVLQSQNLEINGSKTVNLGKIPKIGFYSLLFKDASGAQEMMLVVLDTAQTPPVKVVKPSKPEVLPPMAKYYQGFTKKNLETAWKTYPFKQKLTENMVGITTSGAFGLVCSFGYAPGCVISAEMAKGVVVDFVVGFYTHLADVQHKAGHLTAAELAVVKIEIGLNKIMLGVLGTTGIKTLVVAAEGAAEMLLDVVVTDDNKKVGVSVMRDSTKKTYLIMKKLP